MGRGGGGGREAGERLIVVDFTQLTGELTLRRLGGGGREAGESLVVVNFTAD